MLSREFWTGKKVLLTGHTGFKGTWLSLWLVSLGSEVAGYALEPQSAPSLWHLAGDNSEIASHIADVRDFDRLLSVIITFKPDIIFHLAAQSLVRPSYQDPIGTYATNVMGTVNVLEAVRRTSSVKAAVNVTSDKCYRNQETGRAYREEDELGGRDPYSSSKACAELVTEGYRASFFQRGPAVATARAGNVIGGGDWATDRLLPDFIRAVRSGAPLRVRNPRAVRPWQHVLEPIAGYLTLGEALLRKGSDYGGPWNFGPDKGDAVPVETVVSEAVRLWGAPAAWERDTGEGPHEAGLLSLDSSRARSRLAWRPRMTLAMALEWTVDWYRSQAAGADAQKLTLEQIHRYSALRPQA